jgi:hypothetical protein
MKINLCISFALVLLLACKKQVGPEGPQGPQGPAGSSGSVSTGTISGKVKQYDTQGKLYSTNLNTSSVSIAGTSVTVMTDETGAYKFTNMSAGVYDLIVTRQNSGTVKMQQISFPGNGNLIVNTQISDKANFSFSGGYMKDSVNFGEPSLRINVTFSPSNEYRYAMLYFAKTTNVDPANPESYENTNTLYINPGSGSLDMNIPYSNFDLKSHFKSGSTLQIRLFPSTPWQGSYYDIPTEKSVFPGCGQPFAQSLAYTLP